MLAEKRLVRGSPFLLFAILASLALISSDAAAETDWVDMGDLGGGVTAKMRVLQVLNEKITVQWDMNANGGLVTVPSTAVINCQNHTHTTIDGQMSQGGNTAQLFSSPDISRWTHSMDQQMAGYAKRFRNINGY
ncbi:hypothetical protein [Salipiger sp.]|uniref:hypothetical protein n=1 Tax=Salipiger sp. TaxID=2078585 RepID=UPI003A96A5ED